MNNRLYTIQFLADSGRYYSVTGTDMLLQDMCMGPHVRQRQQREDNKARDEAGLDMLPLDPPRANGEIKGCKLRFDRVRPPFSIPKKEAA